MNIGLVRKYLVGLFALLVVFISSKSHAEVVLIEENVDAQEGKDIEIAQEVKEDKEDKVYEETKETDEEIQARERKKKLISKAIPMDVAHQDYLYRLCEQRGLDYVKTLGIIRHESGFNPNSSNGTTFGYMQIHKGGHARLSRELKTANAPLNPYININWGTKMLSDLYKTFEKEGYEGDKLDRAVWSAYNKGEYGFRRSGEAKAFIKRNYNHIKWVENKLGL